MKSPAFQFYVNDWLSSPQIMLMTPAQEGAYIRLLAFDWANDGIPDDDEALARLSRVGPDWHKGGYKMVKLCFQPIPNREGFLTNPRLQREREKQEQWRKKSSEGGRNSALKRWGSNTNSENEENKGGYKMVNVCLTPKGNSSSSSSSSSSNINLNMNKRPKNLEEVISSGFRSGVLKDECEAFWHHFESTGWIDKNGHEVQNWQSKLVMWKNYKLNQRNNQKSMPMSSVKINEDIHGKLL